MKQMPMEGAQYKVIGLEALKVSGYASQGAVRSWPVRGTENTWQRKAAPGSELDPFAMEDNFEMPGKCEVNGW